jgi:hypothetical protein
MQDAECSWNAAPPSSSSRSASAAHSSPRQCVPRGQRTQRHTFRKHARRDELQRWLWQRDDECLRLRSVVIGVVVVIVVIVVVVVVVV